MMPPPETERLIFRNWTAADLEPFHLICSDPDVMKCVGNGEPWSVERTGEWIERAGELARTVGFCLWALIDKETSALIGFCGFMPATDGAEIGWRIAKRFWRQGLATEAARTVLKHGIETLEFRRVFARVQSPNRPSIRVCEKLGLQLESRFQREGREVLVYSIDARG